MFDELILFLCVKAYFLSIVTVVREGISACDDRVMGTTLQSDETRTPEGTTAFISSE